MRALPAAFGLAAAVIGLDALVDLYTSTPAPLALAVAFELVLGVGCSAIAIWLWRRPRSTDLVTPLVLGLATVLSSQVYANDWPPLISVGVLIVGAAISLVSPLAFGTASTLLVASGIGVILSRDLPRSMAIELCFGLAVITLVGVAVYVGLRRRQIDLLRLQGEHRRAREDLEVSYRAASREVEARRQAEEELARTAERYRLLADHSLDVIWTADADGNVTYMSPAIERLTGVAADQRLGKSVLSAAMTPESRAKTLALLERARADRTFGEATFEVDLVRADSTIVPCEIRAVALRDEQGELEGIQASTRDITRRVEVLAALRESEARFRTISENAGDIVYAFDGEGQLTYVSPSVERILGYPPEAQVGQSLDELAARTPVWEQAVEIFEQMKRGELDEAYLEVPLLAKDGRRIWTEQHGRATRRADGSVEALHVSAREITKQRAAREQLLESEARYRLISENAADVIYVYDMTGKITWVSPSIRGLLGFTPAERIGASFRDTAMSEESVEEAGRLLEAAVRGEITDAVWEMQSRRKDGGSVWTEVHAKVATDDDGRPAAIHAAVRDITERRAAELALRESEERFRMLAEHFLDPILEYDADGMLTYASPAAERFWQLPISSMLGQSYRMGLDSDSLIASDAFFRSLRDGTADSGTLEVTHRLVGGGRVTSELRGWALRDEAGRFEGVQCVFRDVTERNRALMLVERQRGRLAERATQLATLNEQLEAFSSTVSHDLQAPLRRIRRRLEHLDLGAEDASLEVITREVAEMSSLTDRLLSLARESDRPLERGRVEVYSVLRRVFEARRQEDDRPSRLTLPEGQNFVPADPRLFESVVVNLVDNVFKYVPKDRPVELRLDVSRRGDEVTHRLVDNGDGFESEDPASLFEWYRRGEQARTVAGYGIGLASVRRIVERHGGRVWAENDAGGGAAVNIVFRLEDLE